MSALERRFGDVFDCPLCHAQIEKPHVKRHLRAHDRRATLGHLTPVEAAQLKDASDKAWMDWLDRQEAAEADRG